MIILIEVGAGSMSRAQCTTPSITVGGSGSNAVDGGITKLLATSDETPKLDTIVALGLFNDTAGGFTLFVKSSMVETLLHSDMGDGLCMGDGDVLADRLGVINLGKLVDKFAVVMLAAGVAVTTAGVDGVDEFVSGGGGGAIGGTNAGDAGAADAETFGGGSSTDIGLLRTNLRSRSVSDSFEWLCDDELRDRTITRLLTLKSPLCVLGALDASFSCGALIFGILDCGVLLPLLNSLA